MKDMTEAIEVTKDGWVLCHARSGKPVHMDEVVLDFRGEADTIKGGVPPLHSGSTGRVWVTGGGEYFPTVFDLVWKRTGQDKSA